MNEVWCCLPYASLLLGSEHQSELIGSPAIYAKATQGYYNNA